MQKFVTFLTLVLHYSLWSNTLTRAQSIDNRQGKADRREPLLHSRQQTADSRQQTADSRQQTADSRQAVDSRQQTGSRKSKADLTKCRNGVQQENDAVYPMSVCV
jgi:hypothetical protein